MNPKCKIFHTLTRHKEEDGAWEGETGRVDAAMMKRCGFPDHADDVFIAFSGNKGFNETVVSNLKELGFVSGVSMP
jgi:hypothetical protein